MSPAARSKARHAVSNAEVARVLREMALFLEMDEVPFTPRACDKAALAVVGCKGVAVRRGALAKGLRVRALVVHRRAWQGSGHNPFT